MKGTPRPSWTEGRHRWLYAVKMRGVAKPRGTGEGSTATYCRALGWTAIDTERGGHVLTPAGEAVLARWDAGDTTVAPRPRPATTRLADLTPADLATQLLELGEAHARAVHDCLARALSADPVNPAEALRQVAEEVAAGTALTVDHPSFDTVAEALEERQAPQRGHNLAPHIGSRTTPSGYSQCLQCRGRGVVAHNFVCPACHGAGTIRRTVEA